MRERREFKEKFEATLKELEEAKKSTVVVSEETKCDECTVHMSNFASLQAM